MMKRILYPVFSFLLLMFLTMQYTYFFQSEYMKKGTVFFDENNDFEHRVEVFALENGYAVAGKERIDFYDRNGYREWSKKIFLPDYISAGFRDNIVLSEHTSGDVYVLNAQGVIIHKEEKLGALKKIKSYGDTVFVALTERNTIVVYDGGLIYSNLPKGDVLDFEYNRKRRQLAVAMLDFKLDSTLLITTMTGQIGSGRNLGNELVYEMELSEEGMSLITDSAILRFDYDGIELERIPIDGRLFGVSSSHFISEKNGDFQLVTTQNGVLPIKSEWLSDKKLVQTLQAHDRYFLVSEDRMYCISDKGKLLYSMKGKDTNLKLHDTDEGFAMEYFNRLDFYRKR